VDARVEAAARVRDDLAWRYRELPTGHEAMITLPRETADPLIGAGLTITSSMSEE